MMSLSVGNLTFRNKNFQKSYKDKDIIFGFINHITFTAFIVIACTQILWISCSDDYFLLDRDRENAYFTH